MTGKPPTVLLRDGWTVREINDSVAQWEIDREAKVKALGPLIGFAALFGGRRG